MFGSEPLDVGIGVSLFFLLVSLICSAVREAIETVMRSRARDLERGLREMLDDPTGTTITASLFAHSQIFSLFAGTYDPGKLRKSFFSGVVAMPQSVRSSLPSYIPSRQFATALLDIVARGRGDWPYPVDPRALTVDQLRHQAGFLPNGRLQRAVLTAIDHGAGDLDTVRSNVEHWFDGSMDRVSGWYKRRTQKWLFAIGLAAAVVLNLDALTVTGHLVGDKTLRAAFVAEAGKVVASGVPDGATPADGGTTAATTTNGHAEPPTVSDMRAELAAIGAPIGWVGGLPGPQSCPLRAADETCPMAERLAPAWSWVVAGRWLRVILGWLITGAATTFGAPFWFDLLNKFMVIRSTVKPHEKSGEEASDDRQDDPVPSTTLVAPAAAPAVVAATPVVAAGDPPANVVDFPSFEPEQWALPFVNAAEITL